MSLWCDALHVSCVGTHPKSLLVEHVGRLFGRDPQDISLGRTHWKSLSVGSTGYLIGWDPLDVSLSVQQILWSQTQENMWKVGINILSFIYNWWRGCAFTPRIGPPFFQKRFYKADDCWSVDVPINNRAIKFTAQKQTVHNGITDTDPETDALHKTQCVWKITIKMSVFLIVVL